MKYSPTTRGFYPDDAATIPNDAVEVTDEAYAALFEAQAAGQEIVAGVGGVPEAVAPTLPTPTLADRAVAALYAGLTITLSGSVTLAATVFPTDPLTQTKIGLVVTNLTDDGTFPGGGNSFPLKDAAGAWHTFNVAQYKAIAVAIAAYAAPLTLIADGNPSMSSLPASSVSLTV